MAIDSLAELNFLSEKIKSLLPGTHFELFWTAGKKSHSRWVWDINGSGELSYSINEMKSVWDHDSALQGYTMPRANEMNFVMNFMPLVQDRLLDVYLLTSSTSK